MLDGYGGFFLDFRQLFQLLKTRKAVWILVIAGIVIHFNGLFGNFIGDDKVQVQYNYIIQSLSHVPQFFTGSTIVPTSGANLVGPYYRPIMSLSYAVLYSLFGATPFYFHAFQLVLHIINGILIFFLFKKFLKERIALFLSLLFLVHPINSEAVAYIADLQEPLYLCFGLLALLLALKETISPKRTLLISFLLLCSFLSKEAGLLFVFMIITARLLVRWRRSELYRSLLYIMPPVLIYLFLRFIVAKIYVSKIQTMPITLLSFNQRLLNIPAIIFYYLKTFFYPSTLDFFQIWVVKNVTLTNFFLPIIIDVLFFVALFLLGLYIRRKHDSLFPPYLFFVVWFLVSLVAYIQLVPLDFTVSERWFYFPIVGLLGMIGVAWQSYSGRFHSKQSFAKVVAVLAILILCMLSIRTIVRNANWADEITLYNHDLAISDSSILEGNLGNDYLAEKDYQQALTHYQRSANIDPTLTDYYNMALVYMDMRDLKDAQSNYLKALAANKTPRDHEDYKLVGNKIFENLTFIYVMSHEYSSAEQLASKALTIYPQDGRLWENLAVSQYMQGEKDSALNAITTALQYLPDSREIQYVYQQISTDLPIQIGN